MINYPLELYSILFMFEFRPILNQVSKWIWSWFLLFSLPLMGWSQQAADSSQKVNDWVLGLSMTATGYYGDLNYNEAGIFQSDFFSFYPGFNLSFRSGAPRRLNLQFELGYGKIVGQNPDIQAVVLDMGDGSPPIKVQPNRYTETFMVHNNLGFRINLIRERKKVNPYLGVGFGILAFFPQSETGIPLVRKVSTRAPNEDIYNTLTYQMPLSAGVEFNLDKRLGINLSYTYRISGSDYLDNIGNLGALEGNDQLHVIQLGASIHFIDRPERQSPREKSRPVSHPLFSHQLEDPLPTQTPNPSAIIPGLEKEQMTAAPNIYVGEIVSNCDSLHGVLDSLMLALETAGIHKEAEEAGWRNQAYNLLGEVVQIKRERDSVLTLQDQQAELQKENIAFKKQLEVLKEESEDYADQLSFEAMKAENAYLIQEVERLQNTINEQKKAVVPDTNQVNTEALIEKNQWLAKELAKTRRLLVERNRMVQIDTIRIMDSLLLSGQKEGIFVDISGFRVAMIVRGKDPIEQVKQRMIEKGFRPYIEDGSWVFDYVRLEEIGTTVYRISFDSESSEKGFYQLTAKFVPEIGRVSISRYMRESKKAREWVVQMIK